MKAMILAAGKGTRVAPFTLRTPKPLLKIMGKPVIDSQLDFLKSNGIDNIMINTSYLGDKIQEYLGNGARYDMSFTYSYEGFKNNGELIARPLGSAGGLREIQDRYSCFDDTFIVICGDALIDFDFDHVISYHKENRSIATVLLKEVSDDQVSSYGVVSMSSTGKINQFQEKPNASVAISNKVSTGIYIFEPEIFEHIPKNEVFDIGGELLPSLAEKGANLFGFETSMQWVDIGNVQDLWKANMIALNQGIDNFPMRATEIKPGVYVSNNVVANWDEINIQGPVYIGSGTLIEDNTLIIGPAIISENCHIESNSRLSNVIVDPYTHIKAECSSTQQWLSADYTIDMQRSNNCISKDTNPDIAIDTRASQNFENVTSLQKYANA